MGGVEVTVAPKLNVESTWAFLTCAAAEPDTAIVAVAGAVLTLSALIEADEAILALGLPSRTLLTASAIIVVTEAAMSEVRTRFAARLVLAATLAAARDRRVSLPTIEVVVEAVAAAAVERVRLAARLAVAVEVASPVAVRILT